MLSLIALDATFFSSLSLPCQSKMATDEVTEDVQMCMKRPSIDMESLKRKKFKAEDLPISAAQHAAIDKLLHSFKKKGGFDSIRKQIWAEFNDGVWLSLVKAMRSASTFHLHGANTSV